MAYTPSTAGTKKGVKLSLNLPDNSTTSRSYSGLNMGTGGNTAQAGPSISNAIQFFTRAITNLTNATVQQQFAVTEEEYVWTE